MQLQRSTKTKAHVVCFQCYAAVTDSSRAQRPQPVRKRLVVLKFGRQLSLLQTPANRGIFNT